MRIEQRNWARCLSCGVVNSRRLPWTAGQSSKEIGLNRRTDAEVETFDLNLAPYFAMMLKLRGTEWGRQRIVIGYHPFSGMDWTRCDDGARKHGVLRPWESRNGNWVTEPGLNPWSENHEMSSPHDAHSSGKPRSYGTVIEWYCDIIMNLETLSVNSDKNFIKKATTTELNLTKILWWWEKEKWREQKDKKNPAIETECEGRL